MIYSDSHFDQEVSELKTTERIVEDENYSDPQFFLTEDWRPYCAECFENNERVTHHFDQEVFCRRMNERLTILDQVAGER